MDVPSSPIWHFVCCWNGLFPTLAGEVCSSAYPWSSTLFFVVAYGVTDVGWYSLRWEAWTQILPRFSLRSRSHPHWNESFTVCCHLWRQTLSDFVSDRLSCRPFGVTCGFNSLKHYCHQIIFAHWIALRVLVPLKKNIQPMLFMLTKQYRISSVWFNPSWHPAKWKF